MRFTIVQSKTPLPQTAFDFQQPGGTIGRSVDNDLVLPDEDRAISRLQALVHIAANGECRLTNRGSVTPVVLNGQPLARGSQVELHHGDTLGIGEYEISVSEPSRTVPPPPATPDLLALFGADDHPHHDPLGMHSDELLTSSEGSRPAADPASSLAHKHSSARLDIDPLPHAAREPDASSDAGHEEKLLRALLEGMGLDASQGEALTEDDMRMTGRMLSLFSQGTVALLSSRSILKRGVKAEMTMILNEANNPFKILPSGKTVLMQMYQSQMPGFMQPEQAVRDALVDLQAHQLGMIAGIRAIIAAMLQSFNPQRLEESARRDGVESKMPFAAARKAAMWDYFVRNYQHTSGEIEDDFHTLFGEAFLHAYDVEVNQYKDSQLKADDE
ncbi:type VI secretion system-associated FHA domain protein TagH [Erwinia sp. V71]|uniref:type VI secretion system-associated FHA domain protein TagH n=1 Tax=Erwinia sp. V71 TaxID=3369424 RepID=UPI003F61C41C